MSDNISHQAELRPATPEEQAAFAQGVAVTSGAYQERVRALEAQNRNLALIAAGTILYANRRNIRVMADSAVENVQKKIQDRKEKKNRKKTD